MTSSPAAVASALRAGGLVDITTTGRRSGEQRRIEIALFSFDDRLWITGLPGKRGWYANLAADPHLTLHVTRGASADLAASARLVTDEAERRPILERVTASWGRQSQLEAFVAGSPLIEVVLDDPGVLAA